MKIRNATGWEWLTVPVLTSGRHPQRIVDVEIDNTKRWRRRHLNVLDDRYRAAPEWQTYRHSIERIVARSGNSLSELAVASIELVSRALGIETPVDRSSRLRLEERFDTGRKGKLARSEKLARFARSLGATHVLEGASGRALLDLRPFHEVGVQVVFHDYRHPRYRQCSGGFEPYMSTLDLLMNCGEHSREFLFSGNVDRETRGRMVVTRT